jgi:hypothetical protein
MVNGAPINHPDSIIDFSSFSIAWFSIQLQNTIKKKNSKKDRHEHMQFLNSNSTFSFIPKKFCNKKKPLKFITKSTSKKFHRKQHLNFETWKEKGQNKGQSFSGKFMGFCDCCLDV